MTDTLVHRGPDAEGFYIDDFAALGHRRLSIIDLSGGFQPMETEDGQLQIVFNGEIYNFVSLKKQLKSMGYRFRTSSDTETILYAYKEWERQCVEKFNGMFAFAIWDKENRRLFLARDRVGKKPLYYHWDGKTFAFASELKALKAANFCSTSIDYEALDCYFSFGYIPSPKTIFRDIHKLPAAHMLTLTTKGFSAERYWDLNFHEDNSKNVEDLILEFENLFDDAVNCRLMSDVPLGAFLSGGLDSTLVVSSMAKALNCKVLTNSIGFDDNEFNELPLARLVAEHLQTSHKEYVVKPDINDVLPKIAWHFDEPFADSSAVPTWYVCKMARDNVTVALSGDGGDENFGGYTFRYIPHMIEATIRAFFHPLFNKLFFGTIGKIYPSSARLPKPLRLKTIFENLSVSDARAFYNDLVWLRSDTRKKLYSENFFQNLNGFHPFDLIRPLYQTPNAASAINKALYSDIHFYMTENCLVKVDRMSMAHSLEVRSPLLDYRLMKFAASLPINLKIKNGKGKVILRELASKRLPRQILKQPKRGFSMPAAKWLRNELRPMMEDIIYSKQSFLNDLLKMDKVRAIWHEHLSASHDHSVFLWGLIMINLWARQHLGWGE